MDIAEAITAFSALAQRTRLDAFRLLVAHTPDGLAAGEVARRLSIPQNTLSTHLAILEHAGLVTSQRHSRSVIYRAEMDRVRTITSFLVSECCGGHPELCGPLVAEFSSCCRQTEGANAC